MTEHTSTMTGSYDGVDVERPDRGLVLACAAHPSASPRGFALTGRSHVIGREPGPGGFALEQPAVSRMHALAQVDDDGVVIKDMESRNGTWVNGVRVTEARLREGDDVRIGDAVFVFVERDVSAHLAYPLEGPSTNDASAFRISGMAGGLAITRLSSEVAMAAKSGGTVLVLGETGVGKELVARGCHEAFGRGGAFVAVNCAALPQQLVESELFGHVKGAFSGATRDHEGLVRSVQGGTLFLDEIGDLALDAQAKLLRVIEAREVMPVGAVRSVPVDIRLVCATHQDLERQVHEGRFRGDLFARIRGSTIRVPPLRAHKEDIFALVRHCLARVDAGALVPTFPFLARLVRHDWPFNVRELASLVQRAAGAAGQGELRVNHLPKDFGTAAGPAARASTVSETPASVAEGPARRRKAPEAEVLVRLLAANDGNVTAVGRALSCDPAQIYRWIRRYGLDPATFR